MASNSAIYYVAFADILQCALDWYNGEGFYDTELRDVLITRIGRRIGYVKDDIVQAIEADPVRRICERDYVVDFLKMTKRLDKQVMYGYMQEFNGLGARNNRDQVMFANSGGNRYNADGTRVTELDDRDKVRYMPEGVDVTHGGKTVHVSRETTGKEVCAKLERVGNEVYKSTRWVPEIVYEDGSKFLPDTGQYNLVREIPECMVQAMSFMGYIARDSYRPGTEQAKFGGTVVMPVAAVKSQLESALTIANKWKGN